MKRALFLLGLFAALPGLASERPAVPTLAAWVVRDRLTSAASIDEVCTAARNAGVGTLVVQVRGRGDAYYRTDLAPRAEALDGTPEGFDPLAEVLRRAVGLRVLAWINVFLVWSDQAPARDPRHVTRAHADWLLADADGRPVSSYSPVERAEGWIEGIYADPASVDYRRYFAALAAEIASRYPVDGIHLDFVRYPGPGYGRAGPLARRFLAAWDIDPRWLPLESVLSDPARPGGGTRLSADLALTAATLAWAELRASQVTELVREVREALLRVRAGVELSAAVLPDRRSTYLEKGQDWARWAKEGLVDALYPMAYFGGTERVAAQLAEMRCAVGAPGVRLFAGLGAYLKAPDRIAAEAREARRIGLDGVSLYDLGGMLGKGGGSEPYAEAVAAARVGEPLPPPAGCDGAGGEAVEERMKRAEAESTLAAAVARLEAAPVATPRWVDLRGVFRFVHPRDGEERRSAQRRAAEAARDRLRAGEELASVAAQVSQWGTGRLGGTLPRRYFVAGDPADAFFTQTAPGAVTDVVEVPDGYWVYRVEAKGGGELTPVAALSWPARRALLRGALAGDENAARTPAKGP